MPGSHIYIYVNAFPRDTQEIRNHVAKASQVKETWLPHLKGLKTVTIYLTFHSVSDLSPDLLYLLSQMSFQTTL